MAAEEIRDRDARGQPAERPPERYSHRSAANASIRAARRAGTQQENADTASSSTGAPT